MNSKSKALAIFILAFSLLVSGCGPGQALGPTITPTPTSTLALPSTSTPLPPTPTATITPTITNTPTPTPGPELLAYLPQIADLPQCEWVNYTVTLTSASLLCNMTGNVSLSASVSAQTSPLTQSDLSIPNPVATVTVPVIGQGDAAAQVAAGGKDMVLVFYKGNASVRVESYNPRGTASVENVVALAQQVESLVPDQIVPPAGLAFPSQVTQATFNQYFRGMIINIIDTQTGDSLPDYTQHSMICIQDYPQAASRTQQYVVGLFDVQKQVMVSKTYYQMIGSQHCGGSAPSYPQGSYKVDDQYEVQVAVGDALVDIYSFQTK